jgi:sugar phosphate permease
MLYSSVFFAYAAGSLINGRMWINTAGKTMMMLGAGVSILANMLVAAMSRWEIILAQSLINGYFQSMIWTAV